MFRVVSGVLSFFVIVFLFSCNPPKKKVTNTSRFLPKNTVPKTEIVKSKPAPDTPVVPAKKNENNKAPVQKNVVKKTLKAFPADIKAELDSIAKRTRRPLIMQPSDKLLGYLKDTLSDPFSKIGPFFNPVVKKKNVDGYEISITKVKDKHIHEYNQTFADGSKIKGYFYNMEGVNNKQRKVVGHIEINLKGIGNLKIRLGNNTPNRRNIITTEVGCTNQGGIFYTGSSLCYLSPVIFHSSNEAKSGKVYILYKNKHKKEYDFAVVNDKQSLKKLGLFNIK